MYGESWDVIEFSVYKTEIANRKELAHYLVQTVDGAGAVTEVLISAKTISTSDRIVSAIIEKDTDPASDYTWYKTNFIDTLISQAVINFEDVEIILRASSLIPSLIGEVQATPTVNTVLGRLKDIYDKLLAGITAVVSGTVTANAGTNLNTSALALESGGNLAAAVTALTAIALADGVKKITDPVAVTTIKPDGTNIEPSGDTTGRAKYIIVSNRLFKKVGDNYAVTPGAYGPTQILNKLGGDTLETLTITYDGTGNITAMVVT